MVQNKVARFFCSQCITLCYDFCHDNCGHHAMDC